MYTKNIIPPTLPTPSNLYSSLQNNSHVRNSSISLLKEYTPIFESILSKNNITFSPSNDFQDVVEHIDYFITLKNKVLSVDLKSNKNILHDNTSNPDYDWVWIELKNVQGKTGSIYGKANLIGFVYSNKVLLVGRLDLLKLFNSKCSNQLAPSKFDAAYKLYTRQGRLDLISKVSITDIKNNCKCVTFFI